MGKHTHLKTRKHHQLLLLILSWIRMVQVAMKPVTKLIRRLLWEVSTALSLWSVLAAVAVLHRDAHLMVDLLVAMSIAILWVILWRIGWLLDHHSSARIGIWLLGHVLWWWASVAWDALVVLWLRILRLGVLRVRVGAVHWLLLVHWWALVLAWWVALLASAIGGWGIVGWGGALAFDGWDNAVSAVAWLVVDWAHVDLWNSLFAVSDVVLGL